MRFFQKRSFFRKDANEEFSEITFNYALLLLRKTWVSLFILL